jgi:dipeptide transport system substrate-binding protein
VSNYASWCNEGLRGAIQAPRRRPTRPSAPRSTPRPRSLQAEEPALTLAHSKVFMPMNKKVIGYTMDPLGIHRFDNVDVAE